jgi:thiamine transporter ThiT
MNETGINNDEMDMISDNLLGVQSEANTAAIPVSNKRKAPFVPDRKDSYFALFAFVLGFLFARWVLFAWQGWGVTLFTLVFCGSVILYTMKKEVQITKAAWFWLAVVILIGISFGLWSNNGLAPWHGLLLFCSAVYWILSANGLLVLGQTSNLFLLDGYNALFVIPFSNFGCQYQGLAFLKNNRLGRGKTFFHVVLGLFLTFIVALMVLPLLLEADSGGFTQLIKGILEGFRGIGQDFWETFWQAILAIPIAAYIFALVAGSTHKRGTDLFDQESTIKSISGLRILPLTTVYILMSSLTILYFVFIGSQLPYFFSAFAGQRPEGWQIYSEYARSGFFELCRIAVINLLVLTASNIMSQQPRKNILLKILNALLALLTRPLSPLGKKSSLKSL